MIPVGTEWPHWIFIYLIYEKRWNGPVQGSALWEKIACKTQCENTGCLKKQIINIKNGDT